MFLEALPNLNKDTARLSKLKMAVTRQEEEWYTTSWDFCIEFIWKGKLKGLETSPTSNGMLFYEYE